MAASENPQGATMQTIMQKALTSRMPKAAQRYDDAGIRRLISLCRQLHIEAKGGPFFLSCREAGKLLAQLDVQANRWLFLLDHDKVIRQTSKGDRGKRRAADYRYLGD